MRRLLLIVALLIPVIVRGAVPLRSFDTVIGIQRDGSVVVVEKFVPASVGRTFVWSTSKEYSGSWSIHTPRMVEVLQVTSADGRPLNYSQHQGIRRLELRIETTGVQELRIVYAVRNAIEFLNDRDELVWTAGEGWRGDTEKASVFVQVPPEAQSEFKAQAQLSGHGLLPLRQTDAGPDRVWYEAPRALDHRDQLLVDVVLPKGILREPSAAKRFMWFLSANTIVLLPLATFGAMIVLRALKKIPAADGISVVPRYVPPDDLTPAEVGVLLDDRLDPRDVTATLIDLAVRGYIKLEKCKPDAGMVFDHQDFAIRCIRPKEQWNDLQLHERTLLFHTFYGGEWTKLSSLSLRFYAVVPSLQLQVLNLLRRKRMYWTDPSYAPAARLSMLGVFLAVALVIQLLGLFSFASSWLLSLLAIGGSAAIVYYFGRGITSKTLKGLGVYHEIIGFQEFLNSVERDRLERMPGELFEKWLPYAMALGVEHHWANQFEDIALPRPEWLEGVEDVVFSAAALAHAVDIFDRQTRSTLFAMPRSAESRLRQPTLR